MDEKSYKVVNGTSYDARTNDEVIRILEICRENKCRIVLDYGDVQTGKSWGETNDITGYVGRSTGNVRIPILVYNKRSTGGGGILDHCIVRILTSIGKCELYRHPSYHKE